MQFRSTFNTLDFLAGKPNMWNSSYLTKIRVGNALFLSLASLMHAHLLIHISCHTTTVRFQIPFAVKLKHIGEGVQWKEKGQRFIAACPSPADWTQLLCSSGRKGQSLNGHLCSLNRHPGDLCSSGGAPNVYCRNTLPKRWALHDKWKPAACEDFGCFEILQAHPVRSQNLKALFLFACLWDSDGQVRTLKFQSHCIDKWIKFSEGYSWYH